MSAFDNLSEDEKQKISRQNEALNRHMANVLHRTFPKDFPIYRQIAGLKDDDGQAPEWDIPKNKNLYLYWQTKAGTKHCYTPWKDRQGWYWTFTYKGKGPITNAAKFRKRKSARQRAANRYADDDGLKRWKV